jgi:hypothetical protein
LYIEELHNLHSSPNIIKQINSRRKRWAGHVACMGERRNCTRFWRENPEGKRPHRSLRCRWEDGIIMDFKAIVGGGGGEVDSVSSG